MTFNREISSIQKDLKISEDCCKKDGKTAEGRSGPAFKFQSLINKSILLKLLNLAITKITVFNKLQAQE